MDLVENVMTKKVVTCAANDTILNVQRLMMKHHISRVVITDDKNHPLGIVTQKDIIRFLMEDESKRGIEEIKAEEAMSKKLITTKSEAPISDVAETMIKKNVSSLIVVDTDGLLKGVVTKTDINAFYGYKAVGIHKVRDFMTPNPVTVRPSHSIFMVASLLAEHKISRVVVVAENRPVGIITLTDVTMLGNLLKPSLVLARGKYMFVKGMIIPPKNIHLITAANIMTADPITINQNADLADAARLMINHGISGLPVTNDSEKLVGIVTKSDITRAVAALK